MNWKSIWVELEIYRTFLIERLSDLAPLDS